MSWQRNSFRRGALLAAITAAVCLYLFRWHQPRSTGQFDAASPPCADPSTATGSLAAALEVAEAKLATAVDAIEKASKATALIRPRTNSSRDGCSWDRDMPRRTSELAPAFLFGALSVADLVRHEVLNPGDAPLCPEELEEVATLVAEFNTTVDPLVHAYRDLRAQEMMAMADSGQVRPWEGEAASQSDINRLARFLMKRDGISVEEALVAAEKQKDFLAHPPGDYMYHSGKYYSMASFTSLPQSAAYYEKVKFVAGEKAMAVMGWFTAHGLTSKHGEILGVLAGIQSHKD